MHIAAAEGISGPLKMAEWTVTKKRHVKKCREMQQNGDVDQAVTRWRNTLKLLMLRLQMRR